MQIGGLQKFSLMDYPGKISSILFTVGCNFSCPYCYNSDLVLSKTKIIEDKKILEFLEKRKGLIEGVVITGGEPTLQSDLADFIKKIKNMGYSVKLDTNGSRPETLEKVIKNIDYVAMDIKTPLEKMNIVSDKDFSQQIKESINTIMKSGIDYEFRITAYPLLDEKDYEKMFSMIKGAKKLAIQQFVKQNLLCKEAEKLEPRKTRFLEEMALKAGKYVKKVELRV